MILRTDGVGRKPILIQDKDKTIFITNLPSKAMKHTHTAKKVLFVGFIAIAALFIKACITKPDFAFEPAIGFESIRVQSFFDLNGFSVVDSAFITISYRDGNGDIGLTPSDTLPPYQRFEEDGTTENRFFFNYHCSIERKINGSYQPFPLPNDANLNGRISPLTDLGQSNPVEGTITYNLGVEPSIFNFNDTIRFKIFIIDRALNISNTIETDSIIVNPRFL